MGHSDRTERATPKRREEARKKGQIAKSADLNGAVVLLAALMALSAFGPELYERLAVAMQEGFGLIATPEVVSEKGLGALLSHTAGKAALAVAPIALVCMAAGVLTSVAQVGIKPKTKVLKPDFKKLNPLQGAKQIFGTHSLFEGGKSLVKLGAVGAIAALAVVPKVPELASLVGMPPAQLLPMLAETVLDIFQRCAIAYLFIAAIDYGYQRWRTEKQMRMSKQDVKDEAKNQDLPAEVKGQIKRRQREAARARMMAAVPEADVVVTNPTHFAVALKYEGQKFAPEVVAKGTDVVALRIRKLAQEHGVPIVEDKPLARSLYVTVEIGQLIPEEFFQAVAQVLAFVYRTAGRRVA